MKRFIDLRGQGTGNRFAWFDTIRDVFEEWSGFCAWDTWNEFVYDYSAGGGLDVDRYRGLCPKWVFEPGEDDIEGFVTEIEIEEACEER